MDVSSLPKTVTRQRRDCDLNPGPSAPESSTLTTRLPSHQITIPGDEISHNLIHGIIHLVSVRYIARVRHTESREEKLFEFSEYIYIVSKILHIMSFSASPEKL